MKNIFLEVILFFSLENFSIKYSFIHKSKKTFLFNEQANLTWIVISVTKIFYCDLNSHDPDVMRSHKQI